MNDEKLTQLNELSSKIKGKKAVLKKIDELSEKSGVVITEYNSGSVRTPEELRDVFFTLLRGFFTLLRDFYKKQLDALEKEFEEM